MNRKTKIALTVLALAASFSSSSAQTLIWSDTEFIVGPNDWNAGGFPGILQSVNGQLIVTENFFGKAQPSNPLATHVPGVHTLPSFGSLPDRQTLELRADLVSANQNDAVAAIALNWAVPGPAFGSGYMFFKDEDEIVLLKFYNGATSFAYFFYTNQPIANQNVTLVLSLTRRGSNVDITTRVLDKQHTNALLFEHTVTDTPQADPVLPNVRETIGTLDPPGSPWPLLGSPGAAELTLSWFNSQQAPNPHAQVIYDNLELWQYESPQLAIQNAVVLRWPAAPGPWILETADNANGPWTAACDPWCRTNAGCTEASVCAPESRKFFRLRLGP